MTTVRAVCLCGTGTQMANAEVVRNRRRATERGRNPWARILVLAGAATVVASAAVGYFWLERMPELQSVDFGQQAEISATASTSATIFVSAGMSRPPSCEVTSENGEPVTVGEARRYHQGDGLESAAGFPMTSGTTYTVTCRSATEDGRFAVAQDDAVPEGVFIAAGSLGLVLCVAGGLLAARGRQRR